MSAYTPRWRPSASTTRYSRPDPGQVIAVNRIPYRVVEIREIDPANWRPEERDAYLKGAAGTPAEQWAWRPWALVADELPAGRRRHLRVSGRTVSWHVVGEHYAVCVQCGELHPCRHITTEAEVARQGEEAERLMNIGPGCCWSCGEPVTSRQRSIAFDGENLLLPGGPLALFHTRRSCHYAASRYEQRWVAADPRRRWRLQCPGHIAVHADAAECTEGVLCPGPGVPHRGWEDHRRGGFRCARCAPYLAAAEEETDREH